METLMRRRRTRVGRFISLSGLMVGVLLGMPACLWDPGESQCPGLAAGDRFRVEVVGPALGAGGGASCEDLGLDLGLSAGFIATVEGSRGSSCFVWGNAELQGEFELEFQSLQKYQPDGNETRVWMSAATATSGGCSGDLTLHLMELEPARLSTEPSRATLVGAWNRLSGDGNGCPSTCATGYEVRVSRVEGSIGAGGVGP
jgi:hypothetical protein